MASYATRCFCIFFLLSLSFSLQIQARESKFFSKYFHHHRKTQENTESITISLSPTQSPSLAPAPAPELSVVEHGYGLYGHGEPVKIAADKVGDVKYVSAVGEVKYVEAEDLGGKTFRDFVMPNSNDNGWKGNENGDGYASKKQGMSDTRFMENGKYYYDVENEGNVNDKQEMSEYMEENDFPENEANENGNGNGNGYEAEKRETGERYFVNGKYYSGYVTKSDNGNEKQGMSEYVEDENSFPENKENGNGFETKKEETGEKRYFVNGKYYSGYVTGSKNRNGNEKQEMSEYVEDGYSFPKIEGNGNRYQETEKQETGEKRFLVNGKYYTGYVTKSGNGNGNEKQGMTSEYVEDENRYTENEGKGNGYETKKQEMGDKKYLVNGKYYSGYVTKSENGNEDEKQGTREYLEDEHSFRQNKGNGRYENEKQEVSEKKYFVNGKYYNGYVTKSENEDNKNQDFNENEDLGAFNNKNEYANGHNENELYDGNNEYMREGQNEFAP